MKSIFILDDDSAQLNYLTHLLQDDFKIQTTTSPITALAIFETHKFDAVIVDVHMPIINGFEFIQSMRKKKHCSDSAIFILSSDTSVQNKIQALNLGITDFLWPDMMKEEIILRIKNQLSHKNELHKSYKGLTVDVTNLSAALNGKKLELTLIEFKILSFLIGQAGTIITRDNLKEFTWPEATVLDKTINTHLTNLRTKLMDSAIEIKSVKGEGILLI